MEPEQTTPDAAEQQAEQEQSTPAAEADPHAALAAIVDELGLTPEQVKGRLEASKQWERRAKASDTVARADYDRVRAELDAIKGGETGSAPLPEDALEAAREEGRNAAREEDFRATSEAMLRIALRSRGVDDDDLIGEIVSMTNVAAFRDDDGRIDDEKIARFAARQAATASPAWPDMGQDKRPAPPRSGLQAGREAWAQERTK